VADVLLTHSYHLYFDRKQTRKMQPYPPLGTLYAAALLRSAGISVALFDTMLTNPEDSFQAALEQHNPKIVVIYEDNFNFLSKMCLTRMREVAYQMLEASLRVGATVLVNGSDASDHVSDYLEKGFVVCSWARRNGLCWNWFNIFYARAILTSPILPELPTSTPEPESGCRRNTVP